jgi:3-isopropylmalate/(R)-2-methylmalate dehydratase small subunit
MENGIRAVISPKFGDIFRNNATKTGLVPVVVPEDVNDLLMRAATEEPGLAISIDIENRKLSVPEIGVEIDFPMDDFTQYRLLEGLDDIGITMRHADAITEYEATRPSWMPSIAV